MTSTAIQMRFADVDMLGHVNNVNQQHYFDVGKTDFFQQVLDIAPDFKNEGLITVSTTTSYLSQIRFNDPIVVQTSVQKLGNKSFNLVQQIINIESRHIKSESTTVMVAFNFKIQESILIPEEWRDKLLNQIR